MKVWLEVHSFLFVCLFVSEAFKIICGHGQMPDFTVPQGKFRHTSNDQSNQVLEFLTYGWMTCDFTSFLIVYQSNQDDRRVLI